MAARQVPTLRRAWAGGGYSGPLVKRDGEAMCAVDIVVKPANQRGSAVLPRRWVVERMFGWFGKYRRLAERDFETSPANREAWIPICMSNLTLRRLAKKLEKLKCITAI